LNQYAFLQSGNELAQTLLDKINNFKDFTLRTGIRTNWMRNKRFYENNFWGIRTQSFADIGDAGEQGELKNAAFNHFRNVLRHSINQITQAVPSFSCTAVNTDVASRRSAKIGKNVIDYYFKVKKLNKWLHKAAEKAVVYGDGYIIIEWNPYLGKEVAVDEEGRVIKEGDFSIDALSPFDVMFDYSKKSKEAWQWVIFRRRKNKYDLAKAFPEKEEEILKLGNTTDPQYYFEDGEVYLNELEKDCNDIYVYSFYHVKSETLPDGKYVMFAGDDSQAINLYEGKNLYGEQLPVFALSPANFMELSFGYTEANVLRTPQMLINLAVSAMATHLSSFAVNNIWAPTGSNLTIEELMDGMNFISSDIKPEVVTFYQENPNLVNMMNLCISQIETLSGQNSVVRGNVQNTPNLKSGVALATVINMAQEYSHLLQQNYYELFEDLATFMISVLAKIANTERLIEIAGKRNSSTVMTYTNQDLQGISRVVVDRANPLANTPAVKIEMAQDLLAKGKITVEKYFDVINTGNLDNATESDQRMLDFIDSVKEALMAGKQVPPIPGINHQLVIREIQALIYDIDITTNPQNQGILQNILQFLQGQMDLVRNGDEISNFIYGNQPPTPTHPIVPQPIPEMGNNNLNGVSPANPNMGAPIQPQ
jgi:hypothetical protein